jgi:hypothetical protein
MIVEQRLIPAEFLQPEIGIWPEDLRLRVMAAGVFGEPAALPVIDIEMQRRAGDAQDLVQVEIRAEKGIPVIADGVFIPTGVIAENAGVGTAEIDTLRLQLLTNGLADIGQREQIALLVALRSVVELRRELHSWNTLAIGDGVDRIAFRLIWRCVLRQHTVSRYDGLRQILPRLSPRDTRQHPQIHACQGRSQHDIAWARFSIISRHDVPSHPHFNPQSEF